LLAPSMPALEFEIESFQNSSHMVISSPTPKKSTSVWGFVIKIGSFLVF